MCERVTSKEAAFVLSNGDARMWWFNITVGLFIIEYHPDNYPELRADNIFHDKEEGLKRAREMVDGEGWGVLDGEIPIDASSL